MGTIRYREQGGRSMLVGGGGIVFADVSLCIGVVHGVCGDS